MTTTDIDFVQLQKDGGFTTPQMDLISKYAAFCSFLCCVLLRFRCHNANLASPVPKVYRKLREKVANTTLVGDEKYQHTFHAVTPPDVQGAVSSVTVRAFCCV